MEDIIFVRSVGFFDDDATANFAERERERLADFIGYEVTAIMNNVGWTFRPGASAVVTARDPSAKVLAIGWAMQSDFGLNLSYAVATGFEGKGLARLTTSLAVVEAERQYGGTFDDDMLVHAQWRTSNPASGRVASRLGLHDDHRFHFTCPVRTKGKINFLGASAPARSIARTAKEYVAANGHPRLLPVYNYGGRVAPVGIEPYEVSIDGDARFSPESATLSGGRTIEEAFQLDIKGFRDLGNDYRLGVGKTSRRHNVDLWREYKALWVAWSNENPALIDRLATISAGKCLTNKYEDPQVSSTRALAEILNSRLEPIDYEALAEIARAARPAPISPTIHTP